MLAKLWHSPSVPEEGPADPVGTACIGSSEAIMLGGGWPAVFCELLSRVKVLRSRRISVACVGTCLMTSYLLCLPAALGLKKRWQEAREKAGKDVGRPNLVMGAQVHVCWQKFCRYFDVEERYVPAEEGRYVSTPELMRPLIDENTIGGWPPARLHAGQRPVIQPARLL